MSDHYKTPEDEEKSWIQEGQVIDKKFKDWGICVVISAIDMSVNYCVTAPRKWVEEYCPRLLTEYTKFLREPDKNGEIYGMFGGHFVEYSKENIGLWYDIDNYEGSEFKYDLKHFDER